MKRAMAWLVKVEFFSVFFFKVLHVPVFLQVLSTSPVSCNLDSWFCYTLYSRVYNILRFTHAGRLFMDKLVIIFFVVVFVDYLALY
jgi:hypothetical protein